MSVAAVQLKPAESHSERLKRLKSEAQECARRHSRDFMSLLAEVETYVADILDGGEAYPIGIREAARKFAPEVECARLNICSILERHVS